MVINGEVGNGNGSDKMVKRLSPYIKYTIGATSYLTLNTKVVFTQLMKTFIKAPIFCYFDLECHICIETDVFGYDIRKILSWLTLNTLG